MENSLKEIIVNYVGVKLEADKEITAEMVVEVLAEEFPELVLPLAEENFIRGYKQAFQDMEITKGEKNKNQQ